MSYTNADGLFIVTDEAQGAVRDNGITSSNGIKTLVFEIKDATKLGTADVDPQPNDAFIPAGSYNCVYLRWFRYSGYWPSGT